ncbi:MAG: translation elongation factor Ts [Puniceicoccales bacterium]|jgi:elongation factor Ts|nr:translation elongation factor Ts [Puniceicoccales bacterium]
MKISAKMVGDLRELTGAGMVDCKNALAECNGDVEEAVTLLRKKGVSDAAKKDGREVKEGRIESYIHTGGRIGVLLQIQCETDFVARNEQFVALAHDICMHIAAAAPTYLSPEFIPPDVLANEREIAASQTQGKADKIVEEIVRGKLEKLYASMCLTKQPFVKNPDITIEDLIREMVSKIGENIRLVRFSRFQIGA